MGWIWCTINPQINHEARIHHDKSELLVLESELLILTCVNEPVMRLGSGVAARA